MFLKALNLLLHLIDLPALLLDNILALMGLISVVVELLLKSHELFDLFLQFGNLGFFGFKKHLLVLHQPLRQLMLLGYHLHYYVVVIKHFV